MKTKLFLSLLTAFILNFSFAQTAGEYIRMGIELHDNGDFKGAIKKYKKALKKDKNNMSAHYEIAYTYSALKNYKQVIKHADVLINSNPQPSITDQAYDIKGTALDEMGKPLEAIKCYEEGAKYYPNFYLLHFNLGLTLYKTGQSEKAVKSFINAINVRPDHTSSHLILGLIMQDQGKRVQSLLSLYYFLMLEPKSSRSKIAIESMTKQLNKGISSDPSKNSINISVSSLSDDDPFSMIDMMISMSQGLNITPEQKEKTPAEKFYSTTETLFSLLAEKKDENNGFWWDFYAEFYTKLKNSDHLETFCYYINQKNTEGEFRKWVNNNNDKVKAFKEWKNENKVTND